MPNNEKKRIEEQENKNTEKIISDVNSIAQVKQSINDTEEKYKFGDYDRDKFDTDTKKITKEKQFSTGEIQYDPISGEEIVLTQEEAKRRWGDKWAEHAAEGDHIEPLKNVYERGKDKAFVKESDVKEIANQDSNFISISKQTNTRKGKKTNAEFVNDPSYNYSDEGKKEGIELQIKAEEINNKKLAQKNIDGFKETLSESATNSAKQAAIICGAINTVKNSVQVAKGEKDAGDAAKDIVKDTAIQTSKATVKSVSVPITQAAKYSKTQFIKDLAEKNIYAYAIDGIVELGPDIYKAAISKTISWTQLGKNFSVFLASLGGAIGGEALFGIPGSIIGGILGGKAAKAMLDKITKDDAELMANVMNQRVAELASIYQFTPELFENEVLPQLKKIIDSKWLVRMFQYAGRDNLIFQNRFVDKEVIPILEEVSKTRKLSTKQRIQIWRRTRKIKKWCGLTQRKKIPLIIAIVLIISGIGIFIPILFRHHPESQNNDFSTAEVTSIERKFYDENNELIDYDFTYLDEELQKTGVWFSPQQKDYSFFSVRLPDSKNTLEEIRYETAFFMAEYSYLLLQAMLKGEVKYQLDIDNTGYVKNIIFDKNDFFNFYNRLNDLIFNVNFKFDNTYPASASFFKEYDLNNKGEVVRAKENPYDENNQINKKYNTFKSLYKLIEYRWDSFLIMNELESEPRPNYVKPIENPDIFYVDVIKTYSDGRKTSNRYVVGTYKLNTKRFIDLYLIEAIKFKLKPTDYMNKYNKKVKEYLDSL